MPPAQGGVVVRHGARCQEEAKTRLPRATWLQHTLATDAYTRVTIPQ